MRRSTSPSSQITTRGAATVDPRFVLVCLVALFFITAIGLQIDGFNGPWYFKWPWRHAGMLKTAAAVAPAIVVFCLALVEIEGNAPRKVLRVLALLVIGNLLLRYAHLLTYDAGLAQLVVIVKSEMATSYFTDAATIAGVAGWLAGFPPSGLHLHSLTHPPGPILYYYAWLQLFDADMAAAVGGAMLAAIAALSVPIFYRFSALWTQNENLRLWACLFYASTPATVFFFPEFDQVYPILTMLCVVAWAQALDGSWLRACAFGACLAVSLFFAYNLLTVGAFLAMYTLYELARSGWRKEAWLRAIAAAVVSLGFVVGA